MLTYRATAVTGLPEVREAAWRGRRAAVEIVNQLPRRADVDLTEGVLSEIATLIVHPSPTTGTERSSNERAAKLTGPHQPS
jgi:hypothetical protein